MQEFMEANLRHWDGLIPVHERSRFYDVEGFRGGASTLHSIELEELGDVSDKSLLHLQCHFGLDTLSWAIQGARVTGADYSKEAITLARSLASDQRIDARFVVSNIYDLPNVLDERYDIVFTSYGVLMWLPELGPWAEVVSRFLKADGTFYMVEFHPRLHTFSTMEKTSTISWCTIPTSTPSTQKNSSPTVPVHTRNEMYRLLRQLTSGPTASAT